MLAMAAHGADDRFGLDPHELVRNR
jgi:hypothetical protein